MESIKFAVSEGEQLSIPPKMLTRHGIIAGATGTGKTITLKVLAEALSAQGIPVFLSDVKGDLSTFIHPGESSGGVEKQLAKIGETEWSFDTYPVEFFDLYGEEGTKLRATISEMGPIHLARLLELNDVQTGILQIVFRFADDKNLLMLDLKDLRAVINLVSEYSSELSKVYGNISKQSINAILRSLMSLEDQGGNFFFGEPDFKIEDFFSEDNRGYGMINILSSKKLLLNPKLYTTFLFWLLSELYETLPEVGDVEKPKLVFFFDEAHLLFTKDSKILMEKMELIVRLIRSKGIGVFFITQNPTDIPDSISSQLGNRIQHGLRAYSPKELSNVKKIAATFRSDESFDVEETIVNLSVGEAVVSVLQEDGTPSFAKKAIIYPPKSAMGTLDLTTIQNHLKLSPLYGKYATDVDSHSAFESLQELHTPEEEPPAEVQETGGLGSILESIFAEQKKSTKTRSKSMGLDRVLGSALTSFGRELGREVARGVFGNKKR